MIGLLFRLLRPKPCADEDQERIQAIKVREDAQRIAKEMWALERQVRQRGRIDR